MLAKHKTDCRHLQGTHLGLAEYILFQNYTFSLTSFQSFLLIVTSVKTGKLNSDLLPKIWWKLK